MSDAVEKAGLRMDSLEASKEALLSVLREAYEKGPKNKPFDEDWAWNKIHLTAALHGERCIFTAFPKPGKQDVRRYGQIAGALRKVQELLAEENQAEAGGAIRDAWYAGIEAPKSGVIEAPETLLAKIQERYNAALDTLEQLARAAESSAKEIQLGHGRGHPVGGSQLPDQIITSLAAIFKESTGTVPRVPQERTPLDSGETQFLKFVRAYMHATKRHLADSTVMEAIKKTRASSLKPEQQQWASSPFKG